MAKISDTIDMLGKIVRALENNGVEDIGSTQVYETMKDALWLLCKCKNNCCGAYERGTRSNTGAYNLGYRKGMQDILDALKVIAKRFGESGTVVRSYVMNCSAGTIMDQAQYYRELGPDDDVIRVGDEISCNAMNGFEDNVVVTAVNEDGTFSGITDAGQVYAMGLVSFWHKTGRHFDVGGLLKKMKGE